MIKSPIQNIQKSQVKEERREGGEEKDGKFIE